MKDETIKEVTLEDFARSFGTTIDDIPVDCKELIAKTDFRYKILQGEERDKILLDVFKKIESDTQIIGAEQRQEVWKDGWAENLQDFIKSGYDLTSLVPKFIRPNQIVRLNCNYVMPFNSNFELDYFSVFRLWLFKKYFGDFDSIYEFGCGTGFNLVILTQAYPEKKLHGLDFVPSSRDVVNKLGEVYGWKITGHLFDMLSPDESLEIENNSAIFTIGVIEQLASKFEPFLQFLLEQSPKLCLHVEPTIELYKEDNLVDYLAMKFHRKRGYTENYLTRLRELEAQNRIEILKVKRLFFGSLFMEGYSLITWKPKTREE
ncbi:class I SAM-dependent methyltransferase [bacterium]|nr:class I SAM-dependent methyltransferase [bacterium]MBU2461558.1 class I SAM-dependent methyltransferase [bacterium]